MIYATTSVHFQRFMAQNATRTGAAATKPAATKPVTKPQVVSPSNRQEGAGN